MAVQRVAKEGTTHPFGDHRSVQQAFPAGINTQDSDPFLMCDYFNMVNTEGPAEDPDDFPVGWHPHKGFGIASYLKSGTGRHGDSLGNRETFSTPGMQWMATGSGVEHAEGGGGQKGDRVQGFQIWVNTPASKKLGDPRYGTVPNEDMPLVALGENATARVLAGPAFGVNGPFETSQQVLMIDFELEHDTTIDFDIATGLDTAMLYVYDGKLVAVTDDGVEEVEQGHIILFDAASDERRGIQLTSGTVASSTEHGEKEVGTHAILFAGKKLKEPVAWHGPIVMNTQEEIRETFIELRKGTFPPKRVPWDYKRLTAFPDTAAAEKAIK